MSGNMDFLQVRVVAVPIGILHPTSLKAAAVRAFPILTLVMKGRNREQKGETHGCCV